MQRFLDRLAGGVSRRPAVTLVLVLVATLVLGFFAAQQQTETELTAFAGDTELARSLEQIQEQFGAGGASMQVIVDAGEGGDVLTPEGLAAAGRVREIAAGTPALQEVLAEGGTTPPIVSFASAFRAALQERGASPGAADEATVDEVVSAVLSETGPGGAGAATLLSQDLDARAGSAAAGLVIVRFSTDASTQAVADAQLALAGAVEQAEFPAGLDVEPFGQHVLSQRLAENMNAELPMLLGLSLLLIVGILFVTYRRVSDVALGFAGLIVTITWMYGIGVLLGPGYLGLTGPFSQIAIVVPVLLVGLGIDYAIHLTSRYREERSGGGRPPASAATAIRTVGGALVLATVTTLAGFLTNVVSPLPPIRDFGLFVAGGILAAFIVFVAGLPAARSLLDRRRNGEEAPGTRPVGRPTGLSGVMSRAAVVAERAPGTTLVVALAITIAAGVAGSQVSTSFSQDDFIPEDSDIGQLLARFETAFGGAVDERTYVELQGDLTSPEAANAMLAVQANLADTDGVRSAGGRAQASSPAGVVAAAVAANPDLRPRLAELGWTGEGFAPDAEVAAIYDLLRQRAPGTIGQVLGADGDLGVITVATTAGQEGAADLAAALREDVEPLREAGVETQVVSEPLVLDQTLQQLTASQTRSIVITLVVALLVLVAYYGITDGRPVLGAVTMVPSVLVVAWVLGSMWALGLSFNVLTATVASLAIGIGVPFGIHITHRFIEDRRRYADLDEAIRQTVTHTGGALAGSAATTAAGFGVLGFASLVPIQQFGLITALTIVYSLIAAVLVEPACLKLWSRWRDGDDPAVTAAATDAASRAG